MSAKIRCLLLVSAAALLLGGCASQSGHNTGDAMSGPGGRDPLLDAPYRAQMTCVSQTPVTVLSRAKETVFACSDIGVSATLDELRDAGWRLVALNIGEDQESDSHVGFPVTITIRKLF
ncbi:hypothetical protein H6A60_06480 [Sutterella massiliensis]|uniref:DUF4177 domain-containing protein n=1 Tax=Sutterella massiliensis TaxID=1816689 RepID=A0ABS2DS19_9BURK|nr:hypothetical protein [Sutterella massiliensis]MBM6704130.1 hypothetical protein [Sutterella massiliensis]